MKGDLTTTKNTRRKQGSVGRQVVRRLLKNKRAMTGIIILLLVILGSILAPLLTSYGYAEQIPRDYFQFPSKNHLLGTDNFGRDIWSRVLYGGRYTMFIAFTVTLFAALIGTIVGIAAGYFRRLDSVLMRITDIFMGLPQMMFGVSVVAVLGPNMRNMMIALTISAIPEFARIVRAQVLTVKDQEYIEAARSIGASDYRIIRHHILPNVSAPIIVQFTLCSVNTILMSASLSFVGMGVQPPAPEWGLMISEGRAYLRDYWHIAILPGVAIMITTLGMNLLGDGLRDALDPRLKQ